MNSTIEYTTFLLMAPLIKMMLSSGNVMYLEKTEPQTIPTKQVSYSRCQKDKAFKSISKLTKPEIKRQINKYATMDQCHELHDIYDIFDIYAEFNYEFVNFGDNRKFGVEFDVEEGLKDSLEVLKILANNVVIKVNWDDILIFISSEGMLDAVKVLINIPQINVSINSLIECLWTFKQNEAFELVPVSEILLLTKEILIVKKQEPHMIKLIRSFLFEDICFQEFI
jgi:hypothetical protein